MWYTNKKGGIAVMDEQVKTFGELIHLARLAKHINKSELARRVGITPQYVTDIESNRTVPSEQFIEILVGVLDLEEKETFKLADKLPPRILEKARKEYFGE
jgi:transcriptional regulator with XRE-family HTH domain